MRYLRYIPVFLLLVFCILLPGCRSGREKDSYTSRGVDDGIDGFLFNFDRREAVQSMVRYKNKGQYPVKISWHYLKEVSPETETAPEETSALSSEDPVLIRDVYYALSNTIIIDVATGHKEDPHYFVSFTLPDGEECRFDFTTESILHLGDQNYVLESDGNLWRTLRAFEDKL